MSGKDDAMKDEAKKDDAAGDHPASEGVTHFPAAARAKACPNCGKPVTLENRPFCSKRCADIDLGRWLGEVYRIPAAEAPDEQDGDEGAPPDPQPRRR